MLLGQPTTHGDILSKQVNPAPLGDILSKHAGLTQAQFPSAMMRTPVMSLLSYMAQRGQGV